MSDNFTYESPKGKKYLDALLKYLDAKSESDMYNLLKDSTCEIDASGSFSRKRWDAMYTTIYFYIPADKFSSFSIDEKSKARLIDYCDTIMPKNTGLDVMQIEFSPSVEDVFDNGTLEDNLNEISHSIGVTERFRLPDDILNKGKEMAEVYLYLYAIENYIRLFIEKVGIDTYGQDYFSNFTVPKSIRESINGRKRTEEKIRWVRIRGDSELFYLDFIELNTLIQNNWEVFKNYFPDQAWISSKLQELYRIRILVAHNSYVGEHERDILRVNFRSIVNQLNAS